MIRRCECPVSKRVTHMGETHMHAYVDIKESNYRCRHCFRLHATTYIEKQNEYPNKRWFSLLCVCARGIFNTAKANQTFVT